MKALLKYLNAPTSIAPLAVFRVLFGFIMLVSIIRFTAKGWIKTLYIDPQFYFTFYGFEWVKPLGAGMNLLFALMGASALMIMLGYKYRLAILVFFLSFTYVELIDKSNYLNHYYFVSVVSFLLILVPAHRKFSLDAWINPRLQVAQVPAWIILILKLQLAIVYLYAGAAKLNPDWLLEAMPLRIWLPAHAHLPLIGGLLEHTATAYIFSWAGAIYDLTIVFFLLYRRTRLRAFAAVVVFHLSTAVLFQIGMFPYIMILATLVFFSPEFHEKLISAANGLLARILPEQSLAALPQVSAGTLAFGPSLSRVLLVVLVAHFAVQLLIPLRSRLFPGELFWTEQGYRFSWRVMLMEKAGYAVFHVKDPATNRSWEVQNWKYLTPNQEKMMATQPDMILQFAHHLEQVYKQKGIKDVEITTDCYVTLNGKRSRLLIDPEVDLTKIEEGFAHKQWILPLERPRQELARN